MIDLYSDKTLQPAVRVFGFYRTSTFVGLEIKLDKQVTCGQKTVSHPNIEGVFVTRFNMEDD